MNVYHACKYLAVFCDNSHIGWEIIKYTYQILSTDQQSHSAELWTCSVCWRLEYSNWPGYGAPPNGSRPSQSGVRLVVNILSIFVPLNAHQKQETVWYAIEQNVSGHWGNISPWFWLTVPQLGSNQNCCCLIIVEAFGHHAIMFQSLCLNHLLLHYPLHHLPSIASYNGIVQKWCVPRRNG